MPPSGPLEDHLLPDEPLKAVRSGRVVDDGGTRDGSIALTDRRLLCLSEGGDLLDVRYEYVCSVRERRRTRLALRGNDYRLAVGLGSALAAAALLTIAVSAARLGAVDGVSALVLSVVALGGAASAEYVRRTVGYEVIGGRTGTERRGAPGRGSSAGDRSAPSTGSVAGRINGTATADVLAQMSVGRPRAEWRGLVRRLRREGFRNRWRDEDDRKRLATLGGVLGVAVAVLALLSLVAFVATVAIPLSVLVALGGAGLADYGRRHRRELDGFDLVRRVESVLSVATVDGQTVSVVVEGEDTAGDLLRELVYEERRDDGR